MSRKPENATAGEVTAAESRVRVQAVSLDLNQNRLRKEWRESTTPDWQSSFIEMFERVWNRTTQDLNDRLKCSVTPRAGKWNKQTKTILAGLKDIFKDLASK